MREFFYLTFHLLFVAWRWRSVGSHQHKHSKMLTKHIMLDETLLSSLSRRRSMTGNEKWSSRKVSSLTGFQNNGGRFSLSIIVGISLMACRELISCYYEI